MTRFVGLCASAGLVVPLILLGIAQAEGGVWNAPRLALLLWPSSILLLETSGSEGTLFSLWILVLAIVLNAAWYVVLGALGRWVYEHRWL